MKKWQGGL